VRVGVGLAVRVGPGLAVRVGAGLAVRVGSRLAVRVGAGLAVCAGADPSAPTPGDVDPRVQPTRLNAVSPRTAAMRRIPGIVTQLRGAFPADELAVTVFRQLAPVVHKEAA
jgi:hypothetical protein